MGNISTDNGVQVNYPKGCDNAPKKFVLVETMIALLNNDQTFLLGVFDTSYEELQEMQSNVTEINIRSIITHGKDAAIECVFIFDDRESLDLGIFITFKSAGKNIITRMNIYKKPHEQHT